MNATDYFQNDYVQFFREISQQGFEHEVRPDLIYSNNPLAHLRFGPQEDDVKVHLVYGVEILHNPIYSTLQLQAAEKLVAHEQDWSDYEPRALSPDGLAKGLRKALLDNHAGAQITYHTQQKNIEMDEEEHELYGESLGELQAAAGALEETTGKHIHSLDGLLRAEGIIKGAYENYKQTFYAGRTRP